MNPLYLPWLHKLSAQLTDQQHRALVIIQGSKNWQQQCAEQAIEHFRSLHKDWLAYEVSNDSQATYHVTNAPLEVIKPSQLAHKLGQEIQLALFTSQQGIFPNSLAQATGMIQAGNIAILCLDSDWQEQSNPAMTNFLSSRPKGQKLVEHSFFRQHLFNSLEDTALLIQEDRPLPNLKKLKPLDELANTDKGHLIPNKRQPTLEQQAGLEAIHSVAKGHRKRPLLLTADRGRGKSTLLGFAVNALFKLGKKQVVISAAHLEQVQAVFKQVLLSSQEANAPFTLLAEYNKQGEQQGRQQSTHSHLQFIAADNLDELNKPNPTVFSLKFIPPDELLNPLSKTTPGDFCLQPDFLLVDEAAHIPLPMLQKLSQKFNRIVFASTTSGYEGSGKGFQLKFTQYLNQHHPGWHHKTLTNPIRWQANDPLEISINKALLLEEQPFSTIEDLANDTTEKPIVVDDIRYQNISIADLANQPALLQQVFTLLISAHYQTSPNDLMQLLESPEMSIQLALNKPQTQKSPGVVVGVLLAIPEGGFTEEEADTSRLKGHLSAQILKNQTLDNSWLTQKSWRINRLAIAENAQQQGIGSTLTAYFIQQVSTQPDMDYLSVTFGATPSLLSFWQQLGFKALHLGIHKDQASGCHSVTMVCPLNASSQLRTEQRQTQYAKEWAFLLSSTFAQLEADLVIEILSQLPFPKTDFPTPYLSKKLPYEAVALALFNWTLGNTMLLKTLPSQQQTIWIKKICQNTSWQAIATQQGFQGRKALEKCLIESAYILLDT